MERNKEILLEDLYNVQLPMRTPGYTPVPHKMITDIIFEELDKSKLKVIQNKYNIAKDGKQVVGNITIGTDNSDFGMRLAFKNSYDKSMSFGIALGMSVFICSNGVVNGEHSMKRKHTGDADIEIGEYIHSNVASLEEVFHKVLEESMHFKNYLIDERKAAELTGRLFIEEEIINGMQGNIIKEQLYKSENFHNLEKNSEFFSAWDYYNAVTESLKLSHPMNFIKNHSDFHRFMMEEFIW